MVLLIRSHNLRGVIVHGYAHDLQAGRSVSVLPSCEYGDLGQAWPAPCGPEVKQNEFGPIVAQAQRCPLEGRARKVGCHGEGAVAGGRWCRCNRQSGRRETEDRQDHAHTGQDYLPITTGYPKLTQLSPKFSAM